MNTDDKLLIAKAAYPIFNWFKRDNKILCNSLGPQGDGVFHINHCCTRENLCHELKISVGWVDEEQEWFVAGPIFEHEYERICHTKEEKHAAINECSLAILKQEKER